MKPGVNQPRSDLSAADQEVLIKQLTEWSRSSMSTGEQEEDDSQAEPLDLRALRALARGLDVVEMSRELRADGEKATLFAAALWNKISFAQKATPESIREVLSCYEAPLEVVEDFYADWLSSMAEEEREASALFEEQRERMIQGLPSLIDVPPIRRSGSFAGQGVKVLESLPNVPVKPNGASTWMRNLLSKAIVLTTQLKTWMARRGNSSR